MIIILFSHPHPSLQANQWQIEGGGVFTLPALPTFRVTNLLLSVTEELFSDPCFSVFALQQMSDSLKFPLSKISCLSK